MPRQAREKSKSGIYHLMIRGINRQTIFEEYEDYQRFIEIISYYKNISNYNILGYCLMTNHIHLLLQETDESISKVIKRISSSYVYWYNKKYDRVGHLFQERFKSEPVETDSYFLTVLRYIHKNPVKAGITKDIESYIWSSYHEYIKKSIITDIDFALDIFTQDRVKAIKLFKTYTKEENDDQYLEYYEKINLTDQEAIMYIKRLGLSKMSELQRLDKKQRNECLRKIKKIKKIEGITIRQLARITGISKSVIDRA